MKPKPNMAPLTEQELHDLSATKSEIEWNSICDRIKSVRGGVYPIDWWPLVVQSGLMNRVKLTWGET